MKKLKRIIYTTLLNICLFAMLGYGGIFFSKEIKKLEEKIKGRIKQLTN